MRAFLHSLGFTVRAYGPWLKEQAFALCAMPILMAAVAVPLYVDTELGFRVVGLLMQLVGVGTVAWNVGETKQLFGRPTTLASARQWLSRRPRFNATTVINLEAKAIAISGASGHIEMWSEANSDAALEDRFAAIERNQSFLRGEIRDLRREASENEARFKRKLTQEAATRSEADGALTKQLSASQTSGLHVSIIGLFYLVTGMVISTVPDLMVDCTDWVRGWL
jgi:hypothetical protein